MKNREEQTTSNKILNSDIYDITEYVDNIKKINIDGANNPEETLLVGMYGYLGYAFSSLLQNAIVTSAEYANESIPTRAKFDRNVITHALYNGVKKVTATPASMKVYISINEKILVSNMTNNKFTLPASIPINFNNVEFHLDYDIDIYRSSLEDSSIGSEHGYVYSAHYNMNPINPISDIENEYLPPIVVLKGSDGDNYVYIMTSLHQVTYNMIEEKITGNNDIQNKTLTFTFDGQLAYFLVEVKEYNSEESIFLRPIYDGLYNDDHTITQYCYYQYINFNTIRIKFDRNVYQPRSNADIKIHVYTSEGYGGNIEYHDDVILGITSEVYSNMYVTIIQRDQETGGSIGGIDRKTIKELREIIPKEALSRGSITTCTDLKNYFNSINDETSYIHVFRKEDNLIRRMYYTYFLMKDMYNNVVPTNTIPLYLDQTRVDSVDGTMYIESGTQIYLFQFDGLDVPELANKKLGYLDQDVNYTKIYKFNDTEVISGATIQRGFKQVRNYFRKFQTMYFKLANPSHQTDEYYNMWFKGVITSVSEKHLGKIYSSYIDINGQSHSSYESTSPQADFIEIIVSVDDPDGKFLASHGGYGSTNITIFVHNVFENTIGNAFLVNEEQLNSYVPAANHRCLKEVAFVTDQYIYTTNQEDNDSLSNMKLQEGDLIQYTMYGDAILKWKTGEICDITYNNRGNICQLSLLSKTSQSLSFETEVLRVPQYDETLRSGDIVCVLKCNNFVYTSPFSIMINDNPLSDSNRITASYYLDTIKESRFLSFKCVNSRSDVQFIATNLNINRESFHSKDRYQYNISIDITSNLGMMTNEMIQRTRVVIVYYKNGYPCAYSFMDYDSNDQSVATYKTNLYTKPFKIRDDVLDYGYSKNNINRIPPTIDEDNRLYIGDFTILSDPDRYKIYEPSGNASAVRKKISGIYMDLNTDVRIYTLYRYDDVLDTNGHTVSIKEFEDGVTREYKYVNKASSSGKGLLNFIPKETKFTESPLGDSDQELYTEIFGSNGYTLGQMVLTNVYETVDGINLLYDYSNLMSSYVSTISSTISNTVVSKIIGKGVGSIINRVPVVRYFYLSSPDILNDFLKNLKKKIMYTLDAVDPLETTFGIDFKFFNTYGPSNMYYITDRNGTAKENIDNVSLVLDFRAKFYNESSDADTIIPLIKDRIKQSIEQLDKLEDIHFPNITTDIESEFKEYLIYFEFVGFNQYDANYQHILNTENLDMLTVVPEFLNVNTNDDSLGTAMINIKVVK